MQGPSAQHQPARDRGPAEQSQEKWEPVFRPALRPKDQGRPRGADAQSAFGVSGPEQAVLAEPACNRMPAGGRARAAGSRSELGVSANKRRERQLTGVSAKKPTLFHPAALRRGLRRPAHGGSRDRLDAHRLVVVAKVRLGGALLGALGAGHQIRLSSSNDVSAVGPFGASCMTTRGPRHRFQLRQHPGRSFREAALPPHEWRRFVTRPGPPDPTGPRTTRSPILPDSREG